MQAFRMGRIGVFGLLAVFCVILFALSASMLAEGITLSYTQFPLAVAILTLLISLPMLAISFFVKGAVTSMVVVELGWVSFLNILWLANAGNGSAGVLIGYDCGALRSSAAESFCRRYQALQAFSWLGWLLLLAYEVGLIILCVISYNRGNKSVFTSRISETDFLGGSTNANHVGMQKYGMQGQQQNFNAGPMAPTYTGATNNTQGGWNGHPQA